MTTEQPEGLLENIERFTRESEITKQIYDEHEATRAAAESYINQIDHDLLLKIRNIPELRHYEGILSNLNRTTYMDNIEVRQESIRINYFILCDRAENRGNPHVQKTLDALEFVCMNIIRDARGGHRSKMIRETSKRITIGTENSAPKKTGIRRFF